jgi:hypothetical protein
MIVTEGMIPHNGWHYISQSPPYRVDEYSYTGLQTAVLNYRIENHLPVGDVKADVDNYICSNWPRQCQDNSNYYTPQQTSPHPNSQLRLVDRITEHLNRVYQHGQGTELVLQAEAERRASICAGCPYNVQWEVGCAACVGNVTRLGILVRRARETSQSEGMHGCQILGHWNRTAVFLDMQQIGNTAELPDFCWAKR